MDKRPLVEGCIANFGIFQDVFESLAFWIIFFGFSKKLGFEVLLIQQNIVETTLPDGLETSGQRAHR